MRPAPGALWFANVVVAVLFALKRAEKDPDTTLTFFLPSPSLGLSGTEESESPFSIQRWRGAELFQARACQAANVVCGPRRARRASIRCGPRSRGGCARGRRPLGGTSARAGRFRHGL